MGAVKSQDVRLTFSIPVDPLLSERWLQCFAGCRKASCDVLPYSSKKAMNGTQNLCRVGRVQGDESMVIVKSRAGESKRKGLILSDCDNGTVIARYQ